MGDNDQRGKMMRGQTRMIELREPPKNGDGFGQSTTGVSF